MAYRNHGKLDKLNLGHFSSFTLSSIHSNFTRPSSSPFLLHVAKWTNIPGIVLDFILPVGIQENMVPKPQCLEVGLGRGGEQGESQGSKISLSLKPEDLLCALEDQSPLVINCLALLSYPELPCVWISTWRISKGRKEKRPQSSWLGPRESVLHSIQYVCCYL